MLTGNTPDSKVHGAYMGPTWVLSALDGPHACPMNLAIRDAISWSNVAQDLRHYMALLGLNALRWCHNEHDGVSNHQPYDCLLNRLFRRRRKWTSKFRVTGLCERNSLVNGEIPAQIVSNAEMFPLDDVMTSPCCRIYESVNQLSIGSGNGLSPLRRQAITWTKAGWLSTGLLGTNLSEIRIGILSIFILKMHFK